MCSANESRLDGLVRAKLTAIATALILFLQPAHAQDAAAPQSAETAPDVAPVTVPAPQDAEAAPAPSANEPASPAEVATIPLQGKPEAEPAAEPASEGNPTHLDDVVVTATKREESTRKIAGTVNALTGEQLEAMGARELADYLHTVPGISLQEGVGSNARTLSIRGVTPGIGANQTVGVLLNDVSLSDPYGNFITPDLDPFDLNDVEILKGPQGTLFGAAALNGAVRYVLNKPELDQWQFRAFGNEMRIEQGGSGATWGAAVNAPLPFNIALRGVVVSQQAPGLYDNVNVNKDIKDADSGSKTMYRLMARWQATDALSVDAFYLSQKLHRNDMSVANNLDGEYVRTDSPNSNTVEQDFTVANLDIRYNFDWATLVSQTSRSTKLKDQYIDGSGLVEPLAVRGIATLQVKSQADNRAFAQELRLVSPAGSDSPWSWIGGAYYYDYSATVLEDTYVANTVAVASVINQLRILPILSVPLDLLTPNDSGVSVLGADFQPLNAREMSVFGEVSRKFWDDRLKLTLGARAYDEKLNATLTVKGVTAPYGQLLGFSGPKKVGSRGVSPKISGTFQFTPDVQMYATVQKGFQFGGFNAPAAIPTDNVFSLSYKPSSLINYEAGLRTDWFDRTLQVDLTAFLIDWTDMQIAQPVPSGAVSYIDNVGKARVRGLEGGIRWLTPLPGLMLSSTGSYILAKVAEAYTSDTGDTVPSGWDLPMAPHLQYSATAAYKMLFWDYHPGISVTYSHQGPAYCNINHDKIVFDYNTIDAGLSFSAPLLPGAPELSFNVSNLTDVHALAGTNLSPVGTLEGVEYGVYTRPRSFVLKLSVEL